MGPGVAHPDQENQKLHVTSMIKVKTDLSRLTDEEFIAKVDLIVNSMTGNANFTTPNPALSLLATGVYEMNVLINERNDLDQQSQTKTVAIRNKRNLVANFVTNEAGYVQGIANASTDPNNPPEQIVVSAGMEPEDARSPVGSMPKIVGLFATQGDADGEIDLHWNPIKRGLNSYVIEYTTDPAGQTGWGHTKVCTASKITLTGLTSATRYWFRVAAVGAAGQGPWSDAATKVAP